MPRRLYLLGVGLALALAATDWALSLQPGVTERNVNRIRPGMTLAQVEGILGGPPKLQLLDGTGDLPFLLQWEGQCGSVIISTRGESGRVEQARWTCAEPPPNLLARLRAWLGW
jgi:hypothetical protein